MRNSREKLGKITSELLTFWEAHKQAIAGIADGMLRHVYLFIALKSTKSLAAIKKLCEEGYYEDAAIIGRSLLENLINLAYLSQSKRERIKRIKLFLGQLLLDNFRSIGNDTELRRKKAFKEYLKNNEIDHQKAVAMHKKEQLKKRRSSGYNRNEWSCLTLEAMAIAVKRKPYYRKAYKNLCKFSHLHPAAMKLYLLPRRDGSFTAIDFPRIDDDRFLKVALLTSIDCYAQILGILVREINGFDTTKLDQVYKTIIAEYQAS